MRSTQRGRVALFLLLLSVLTVASPALARQTPELVLREARLAPDGTTRLLVGAVGLEGASLDDGAFRVLEDGQEIEEIDVDPLSEFEETPVVVALAFDISGSVRPVFDQIQTAAVSFVRDVTDQGVQVALIPFSTVVEVTVPPTNDAEALEAGIAVLQPGGPTPLYDAIVTSAAVLEAALAGTDGLAQIVVFSDGGDAGSEGSMGDAIAAAQGVDAPITSVAWETEDLDPAALGAMAFATGGTVVASEDAAEIEGLFRTVAADITSQYVIRYSSDILEPAELPITVIAETPVGEMQVDSMAINGREADAVAPPAPTPSASREPMFAFLGTQVGLWMGLLAAFVAALALAWVLLVSTRRTPGARSLDRGLPVFTRRGRPSGDAATLPTSRITERAIDLVSRVPKPKGFDQRLQLELDRAAWLVRSNEFLVMSLAVGILGAVMLGGGSGSFIVGLVALFPSFAIPTLILKYRVSRRRNAFMDQLPGTLQLLAGSLRAGYGLLQAIDTVVRESEDPTSTEFARVLTEARLGMPLDESMEAMAERLESEDFHWVVLAIGIQREVGGNLAELLSAVADTMRARATLRRQIRVLSAEGRISAWIVGLMPFVVAFALSIINPGYLGELFSRPEGLLMLVAGAVSLVLGMLWLRKIVNIEV